MFSKLKKIGSAILLSFFILAITAGSLLTTDFSRAQAEFTPDLSGLSAGSDVDIGALGLAASGMPVTIASDLPRKVESITTRIKNGIKTAIINVALQTASYFMRRVAYDTAVWLASGGKGETPFAHYKDFSGYIADVGDHAAGVAIDALGAPYGLNLCKIPDPKIDLAMRIGLTRRFMELNPNQTSGIIQPNCTWSSFQQDVLNTDNWQSQFGSGGDIARKFNVAFSVEQSDLGILLSATEKIDNIVAYQTKSAELQRQEGDGYKPKESLISGNIVTPAKNIAQEAQSLNPSEQRKRDEASFLATLSTGLEGAVGNSLNLFLNSLGSQMVRNFQQRGMFPFGVCIFGQGGDTCGQKLQDTLSGFEGQVGGGRQAAQALFAEFLTPPNLATNQYDALANFTSCPVEAGPENCVADESLAQAAQETNFGKPTTVADALKNNWLHGEWKLISPERSADNTDKSCYSRAYCYANIVKLRKARILPLGFEIAAINSNPDKPWTLKQVVDGFNDCNFIKDVNGKVVGVNNDPVNKPFCHLIDPNWVLKAPPSKCNFMAYGASPLFGGGATRAQECADLSTCVAYDKDGNCATQGYCTREKNVWKIDAAKCSAQYRTCRSFQDSTGKNVSYLYRTLDTGYCTQDNVGCAQYSLKQDSSGNWANYSSTDLGVVGKNSAIYFNNKISSGCSANSDGCSAFVTASTSDQLYLRQAPYYSQCYDADPSTLAVDWPQTSADLNRLSSNPKCNSYAAACIPDEVNCNWYSPISYSGDRIPGKYTAAAIVENQIVWNDQCDARCVGYAAYKEMPNNYSNGQAIANIIPSSGSKCNAVDEGCASFTNLGATAGGVEKVEHYSYLRPCILPDTAKQKNFYTYEGVVAGGYQLKGFVLEKDTDGSPKYFYSTPADVVGYNAICTESLYKSGAASPDCRQFNDEAGNVYYKLLSKTIAVSSACTPYRLNNTELAAPGTCFQNGEFRDGQCFYYGLPGGVQNTAGASSACAAEVNTCRAYKGNTGNNVRNIFNNNFEGSSTTAVLAGWVSAGSISQSLESTHAGEHSLSYNGGTSISKNLSLTPGRSYDLTFWAKGGTAGTVNVTLENGSTATFGAISVGDVWQYYHLGPVELGGSATSTQLRFSINGRLFLDNVVLKEVADYIYLVKNTLKVDPVCDSNLNDNLPGEALGCSEYKKPDNASIYLTKFSSLCREKAIGCTSLYDTRNTPNEAGPRAYNVWLSGAEGAPATRTIGGISYSCQVPVGQAGCYVNVNGATIGTIIADGGTIVASTIYIQPDTPTSTPIYLVASRESSCNAADLGCTKAGRQVQTPVGTKYQEVLIKNDPALYSSALCQSEAVGCSAYGSAEGALYFKDPSVVGQKVCTYRENVLKNGVQYNGWFWKGVGACSNNASQFCSSNNDCGAGNTCNGIDEQACYPSYLQTGNNYGLWSYGVAGSYNNFVGECPQTQNGCTEFIDRNENNKTHYLINDDRLKASQTECDGQISEKSGCILLDQTDKPNKLWNTAQSYAESAKLDSRLVSPVGGVAGVANDANVILKVDRDRECGEWLQCRSSHRVFDQQSGTYKEICDAVGRCNQSPESAEKGDLTNCANWVDSTQELSNQVLTDDAYRDRSTDWEGQEFSGYSIFNSYPVEELSEVNFGSSANPQWRLAKKVACGGGANCANTSASGFNCAFTANGRPCGRGNSGICVGGSGLTPVCVQNPDGSTADVANQSVGQSCRAYPEETSPFPSTEAISKTPVYGSVNLCNESLGPTTDKNQANSCDCDYNKISYGGVITKYWNFDAPNQSVGLPNKNSTLVKGIVSGVCSSGINKGRVCGGDDDCGTGGTCQKAGKQSRLVGWHGYCLEPDISRPLNAEPNNYACLTWFPIDTIMGVPDINNQHVEAGFQESNVGGKYYCLNAKGNQQLVSGSGPTAKYSYDKLLVKQPVNHCGVVPNPITTAYTNCLSAGGGNQTTDREKRVFLASGAPILQDEIDYIKIVAHGNGNWFPNNIGYFYIRNGLVTKYNSVQWSVVGKEFPPAQKLDKESVSIPFGQYVYSDGTAEDAWYIRYDDGQGDSSSKPQFQFADPTGREISSSGFLDLLSSNVTVIHETGGADTVCGNIDSAGTDSYQGNCIPQSKDIDDSDDGCAIKVSFDSNKALSKINFTCFTGDGIDKEDATFDVYVGLRESCLSVAQTTAKPYDTVGWTNRLWQNAKYVVSAGVSPNLNYPFSLLSQPFGSLGMGSLVASNLVNIFTHYNKTTFDPPPAIVGSPYSCGDATSGRKLCLDTNTTTLDETVNGRASTQPNPDNFFGHASLGEIFAKVDSIWNWTNSSGGSYLPETTLVPDLNTIGAPWSITGDSRFAVNAPKVRPLGACKTSGNCLEENVDGFTVNGKSSGDLVFPSHVAPVNLKFFGFANENQMPIRKMQVDWGDDNVVSLDGRFRNHRGTVNGTCGAKNTCMIGGILGLDTKKSCASNNDCRSLDNCFSENNAPNFGQITDKTCDNAYFRFDHVYQCLRDGAGWTTSCPDAQTQSLSGGCCVFKPKVQLKDNWNWCNGTCGDAASVGGTGCYEKDWGTSGRSPECGFPTAWTSFDGNVIVAPQ